MDMKQLVFKGGGQPPVLKVPVWDANKLVTVETPVKWFSTNGEFVSNPIPIDAAQKIVEASKKLSFEIPSKKDDPKFVLHTEKEYDEMKPTVQAYDFYVPQKPKVVKEKSNAK